jgi:mono/diheme cytochrome c family protein
MYIPPASQVDGSTANEASRIEVVEGKGWNFPDRTVLVKSFALEFEPGNPWSRRWIETRFMTKQEGEWVGYSYAWNDEQTEATLVESEGRDRTFELRTPSGVARQQWRYPSRAECMVCHSRAANFVLGLSTAQMNREHDYGGVRANQLEVLEALGLLRVDAETLANDERTKNREALKASGLSAAAANDLMGKLGPMTDQRQSRASHLLSKSAEDYPRLANPYDAQQPIEARARSYLQANCAHCHVYAGGGNSEINLLFSAPLSETKLIGEKPVHDTFGIADARLVAPGHPERSVLLHRVSTRGGGQMPQLATSLVDRAAVEMLRAWITSVAPPAAELPAR